MEFRQDLWGGRCSSFHKRFLCSDGEVVTIFRYLLFDRKLWAVRSLSLRSLRCRQRDKQSGVVLLLFASARLPLVKAQVSRVAGADSLVIEAPSISRHVVEPPVGAARRFGEQQDCRAHRHGENTAGQRNRLKEGLLPAGQFLVSLLEPNRTIRNDYSRASTWLSSCRNNAMNSSSVFLVFTTRCSLPLVLS